MTKCLVIIKFSIKVFNINIYLLTSCNSFVIDVMATSQLSRCRCVNDNNLTRHGFSLRKLKINSGFVRENGQKLHVFFCLLNYSLKNIDQALGILLETLFFSGAF